MKAFVRHQMPCLLALLALATLPACSNSKQEQGDAGKEAPAASGQARIPDRISLTPTVIAAAGISSQVVARETLAETVDLPGSIVTDPDRSARVSSPIAGRIEQVSFQEGSVVRKGESLAVLRVPDLGKARAAYAASTAKAGATRANAERLGALAEKGLASKQEAQTALAEAAALEADAKAAAEQLSAMGLGTSGGGAELVLRAPLSGVIMRRNAVLGQPVATNETLALIADLSEVWFLGRVFERDLAFVRVGAKASVSLNAYGAQTHEGSIEYLGQEIDPASRTLLARIRLTNRDELLRIGLFGTARIERASSRPAEPLLVVPREALDEMAGQPVVFVRLASPANTFERRLVVVGRASAQKVEIASGVSEGESLVSTGIFTVKSAFLKGTFGEEE